VVVQGANLLVTSKGRIKLADFGASRKIEELASCGERRLQCFGTSQTQWNGSATYQPSADRVTFHTSRRA
jgi:serine/threonine protein kinase